VETSYRSPHPTLPSVAAKRSDSKPSTYLAAAIPPQCVSGRSMWQVNPVSCGILCGRPLPRNATIESKDSSGCQAPRGGKIHWEAIGYTSDGEPLAVFPALPGGYYHIPSVGFLGKAKLTGQPAVR